MVLETAPAPKIVTTPVLVTAEKFESDKEKLLSKLQERGYRDARLLRDSIAKFDQYQIRY